MGCWKIPTCFGWGSEMSIAQSEKYTKITVTFNMFCGREISFSGVFHTYSDFL